MTYTFSMFKFGRHHITCSVPPRVTVSSGVERLQISLQGLHHWRKRHCQRLLPSHLPVHVCSNLALGDLHLHLLRTLLIGVIAAAANYYEMYTKS
jgi:hypothetical protein